MKRLITALVLVSSLSFSSCAIWDWLKPASDGIAVEAELTIGDKSEEIITDVTGKRETTTNTADEIIIHNIDKNPGVLWSLLFFLGWLLPGPPIPWSKVFGVFKRR